MRRWLPIALLAALAGWSCAGDPGGPTTQVMLRIHKNSADPELMASMTALSVTFSLYDETTKSWRAQAPRVFEKGLLLRWPVDIPIVPSRDEDAAKTFEVVVDVLGLGQQRLAQQRAVSGFVADDLRLLELWLYRCPGHGDGFVCASPTCTPFECTVCKLDGMCGTSQIDRSQLPAFDPDLDPSSALPPGFTVGAGGTADGGQVDAAAPINADAAASPNAMTSGPGGSTGDAGSPPRDAGGPSDAGAVTRDAGAPTDAGSLGGMVGGSSGDASVDAGRDAGSLGGGGGTFAGGLVDAGIDAAVVRDAGRSPEAGLPGGALAGIGGAFAGGGFSDAAFSIGALYSEGVDSEGWEQDDLAGYAEDDFDEPGVAAQGEPLTPLP